MYPHNAGNASLTSDMTSASRARDTQRTHTPRTPLSGPRENEIQVWPLFLALHVKQKYPVEFTRRKSKFVREKRKRCLLEGREGKIRAMLLRAWRLVAVSTGQFVPPLLWQAVTRRKRVSFFSVSLFLFRLSHGGGVLRGPREHVRRCRRSVECERPRVDLRVARHNRANLCPRFRDDIERSPSDRPPGAPSGEESPRTF